MFAGETGIANSDVALSKLAGLAEFAVAAGAETVGVDAAVVAMCGIDCALGRMALGWFGGIGAAIA